MKLEQLMEGVPYTLVQGSPETEINDIIYDSRKAAPGLLFVCIVGTQRDSHEFTADCAAKGVTRAHESYEASFLSDSHSHHETDAP